MGHVFIPLESIARKSLFKMSSQNKGKQTWFCVHSPGDLLSAVSVTNCDITSASSQEPPLLYPRTPSPHRPHIPGPHSRGAARCSSCWRDLKGFCQQSWSQMLMAGSFLPLIRNQIKYTLHLSCGDYSMLKPDLCQEFAEKPLTLDTVSAVSNGGTQHMTLS